MADPQRRVDEHFAAEAPYWDEVYEGSRVTSAIYRKRQDIALRWSNQLGLSAETPVLELGCGAGHLAAALVQRGLRVTATDSNPAMVELARRRAQQLGLSDRMSIQLADAHALQFPDATFGLIVALGVLSWLHSPRAAMHEITRVLRPEGHAILTADNRLRLDYLLDPRNTIILHPLRQRVKRPLQRVGLVQETQRARHNHLWRGEFLGLLREAGLDVLAMAPCGFGPFTLMGRRVLPESTGLTVNRILQQLAERGTPIARSTPDQYVALCRRRAN